MATVSLIVITALLVISLANLLLLVNVIVNCNEKFKLSKFMFTSTNKKTRYNKKQEYLSYETTPLISKINIKENNFLAAIIILPHGIIDNTIFACNSVIISQSWALSSGFCVSKLLEIQMAKIRISGNATDWREGFRHEVEKILIHEEYYSAKVKETKDIGLLRVKQKFDLKFENPIALYGLPIFPAKENLPSSIIGWLPNKIGDEDTYFPVKTGAKLVKCPKNRGFASLFCLEPMENLCNDNFYGMFIQNNVLIGLQTFNKNCEQGYVNFTLVSHFKNWFKRVESNNSFKIGAKFAN